MKKVLRGITLFSVCMIFGLTAKTQASADTVVTREWLDFYYDENTDQDVLRMDEAGQPIDGDGNLIPYTQYCECEYGDIDFRSFALVKDVDSIYDEEGEIIDLSKYTISSVAAKDLVVSYLGASDENEGTVVTGQVSANANYPQLVNFGPSKVGYYSITVGNATPCISYVRYPDIALWKTNELSEDNLIKQEEIEYVRGMEELSVYLHITEKENDIEDPWWDLALADGTQKDYEGNTIYPFVVHEWTDEGEQQYDGSQEGVEDYFSVEAMGEGWYKLTIDPSIEERECGFDIQVRGFQTDFDVNFDEDGKITSREARDSFSRDRYVSVHYLVEGLYVHDVEKGWYDSFLDAGVNPNTSVISLVKFSLDQEGKAVKEKVTDLSELQIYQFIYQEETDCEEWVEADAADYKIEKVGEDQFSLLFYVEGVYEIRVDGIESGLQVGAWQPALGFYTSSTRPQGGPFTTLLGDEISYQEGTGQSVYLLAWLDSTNPSAVDIGSVKWNVCDSDGKVLTTGDYIITEAVKDAEGNVVGYKVTNCNKDASDFRIQAICQRNGGQDEDGIEHEREEVIAEITFHGIRKEAPAKPVASPIVTSKKDTASTSNKVGNPVAKVGDQKVSGGLVFEIRNVNKKTVTVRKCNKKNATKVTIPASVKIGGTKYAVTEISKNALKNCKKLKKITIKSKKITKIGKKAFQGVNKKAVIKVPKSRLKKYKKLFKKAGFKGKVKA